MNSIRRFLIITLLSVVTLLNFLAAVRGYQSSMHEAEALFNQRMFQQVELLSYILQGTAARGTKIMPLPSAGISTAPDVDLEFQWLDAQGKLLTRSERMPDHAFSTLQEGFAFHNFSGYRWHVLVARSKDQANWIILAERDDQRFKMAESVILPAVFPMVVAIPVLGLLIWVLLGVGLRPVAQLAADLERRGGSDLHPAPLADMPVELKQLAHATNALLRRLSAAFAREKRFSADAAHELRTPIAALRIQVENLGEALPDSAESINKLKQGIERMQHIVEQILLLNRIAPDQFVARLRPVLLGACVRAEIALQSEALSAKALDIELLESTAWINAEPFALAALLRNLLDNAIKYTPQGGQIRVQTLIEGTHAVLLIADSGIGIPAELRGRALDRFYRVGGDRHRGEISGCGLGLSIVQQVADLHDAPLELRDSPFASGLEVRVQFTAIAAPEASDTSIASFEATRPGQNKEYTNV